MIWSDSLVISDLWELLGISLGIVVKLKARRYQRAQDFFRGRPEVLSWGARKEQKILSVVR